MSGDMKLARVGQVRPSQLLWTYGPGALVDLPNLSVMTLGLDDWKEELCPELSEARLLAAVRRVLGPQVERLRMPPATREDHVDPFSATAFQGIKVRPFPRWLRCVRCGLMADIDTGLFTVEEDKYRPERTRYVHVNCTDSKGSVHKKSDAVPVRFVSACRNGHLDDFPWFWYVHGGPTTCAGPLRFFENGASLQTENLFVKCDTCGKSKTLAHAFGKEAKKIMPRCRGRHPHLDHFDGDCGEQARTVLLGATNSWFGITISALAIPMKRGVLAQFIEDGWGEFHDVEDKGELKGLLKGLKKTAAMPGIEKFEVAEIWEAIEAKRKKAEEGGDEAPEIVSEADIKVPEWEVLTNPDPENDWPNYKASIVDVPAAYVDILERVILLERLREVNALIGFTRVEAPDDSMTEDERPAMANLCNGKPTWVPASEVHGEGIFLQFKESTLNAWAKGDAVQERDARLFAGHRGWRNRRHLDPDRGYPGIRYAALHTLAHMLIRELALACGYNAASIRERIYATTDDSPDMAGILLYTAAADSDGTLGGLVDLGRPENLAPIIEAAINRATVCSSDPLCSEHNPADDQSTHGAACHACSLVAETSCERGNRYLDRALVVPTFEERHAALFKPMGSQA